MFNFYLDNILVKRKKERGKRKGERGKRFGVEYPSASELKSDVDVENSDVYL